MPIRTRPTRSTSSASGKLTEPLVDTPRTVTAIPKEVIDDKGAAICASSPARFRGSPSVRPKAATPTEPSRSAASRPTTISSSTASAIRAIVIPEVFSVQQVEIYKGPSRGIAGRNTIGGAVNIISKQPDLTSSFFEVTKTFGTDHTFRTWST